jgi:hypothetical protein
MIQIQRPSPLLCSHPSCLVLSYFGFLWPCFVSCCGLLSSVVLCCAVSCLVVSCLVWSCLVWSSVVRFCLGFVIYLSLLSSDVYVKTVVICQRALCNSSEKRTRKTDRRRYKSDREGQTGRVRVIRVRVTTVIRVRVRVRVRRG